MKTNITRLFLFAVPLIVFASCVSRKKYLDAQIALRYLKNDSTQLAYKVSTLNDTIANLQQQIANLNKQIENLNNTANATQSKLTKSEQSLQEQQQRLQQLQNLLDQQKQNAEVLNGSPDISVNIEGHTDSIPIRVKYQDNWALSTARAASIVRILVNDYKVDPVRVIASGHGQYDPVDINSTEEGRAKNRRTEIILSPKLDELYKLLEQ